MNRFSGFLIIIFLIAAGCTRQPEPLPPGRVVVLMYHRISEGAAANLYERSAADFEADLKFLRTNNISVISFEELETMISKGEMPSGDAAVITFDDGDHSWVSRAKPLLIKYEMKATFFLWVSMIGRDSYLNWEEVAAISHYMDEEGTYPFTFGSHTMSHQFLLTMKAAIADPAEFDRYLDEELGSSATAIEQHTPGDVSMLALPFGDGAGDEVIKAGAERNGYRFIRTSERGVISSPATDLFRIPSLPILDSTDPVTILTYLGR
jgi:peptidoglycan/xylan/chitin deacetylase (PgdA/CDA1 family)